MSDLKKDDYTEIVCILWNQIVPTISNPLLLIYQRYCILFVVVVLMSMSLCTIYKTVPSYYLLYSLIAIVGVLYVMEIVLMEYILLSQEVNQGIRLIYIRR